MPVTRALSIVPLAFVLTTGVGLAQTSHAGGPASTTPVPAVAPAAAAAPATAIVPTAPVKAEDAVEPQGFAYTPDGRRDPFVSLLRRGADSAPVAATRESGLAGLGAAEISLRGTIKSAGAFAGIVRGADSKTYIVRAGDKLADGSIRTITADSMVILQQVSDPLSPGKVQEVRKGLRQTEEGK
jgi:Tfp pilus assembly protein PilP